MSNIGRVIDGPELRKAGGHISEWARRVRELRDEEGYEILTHRDRSDLKPGQYILLTSNRRPIISRSISKELRARVLDRNGFTCCMCGASANDPDPFHADRKIRLTIGHIVDFSKGGKSEFGNLRAECTNCNEGLQNTSLPKPSLIELLKQIRRATIDDQRAVLEWLQRKFQPRL
ncbi:MAG: HNH endonuclease [Candidatus Binataceae bacterium]